MQALCGHKLGSGMHALTIGTLSQAFNLLPHPDSACILVGVGEKLLEASRPRCGHRPEGGKRPHHLAWEQGKGWHQAGTSQPDFGILWPRSKPIQVCLDACLVSSTKAFVHSRRSFKTGHASIHVRQARCLWSAIVHARCDPPTTAVQLPDIQTAPVTSAYSAGTRGSPWRTGKRGQPPPR
jgi:hypothetical protein